MSGWKPIETAPRDCYVLGWFPKRSHSVYTMHWDDDRFSKNPRGYFAVHGWGVRDNRECQPTYWMPLPAPPQEAP